MASEPDAMREIHEIRLKIYEEIKDLSPEEYKKYWERSDREMEEQMLREGYRFVPSERTPGCRVMVHVEKEL